MPLLVQFVLSGAEEKARRSCLRVLLAAIALFVATMGLVLLVASVFLLLTDKMAIPAAAAVTGGGLLAAAGLIALAVLLLNRRGSRRTAMPKPAETDATNLADLLRAAEAAIGRDARSDPPLFPLLALLAGCAIGASPRLRRVLADLIR
jgi:hypothetical protein